MAVVRSRYSELRAYLEQAPADRAIPGWSLAKNLANAIGDLSAATDENYYRFAVEEQRTDYGEPFVDGSEYRSKLAGLVARLEQEYGLGGAKQDNPSSVTVNLSQTLSQLTQVTLSVELQSLIDRKLGEYPEGSNEHGFLQRVKASVGTVKDIAGVLGAVGRAAHEAGLKPEDIARIFGAH